MGEAVFLSGLIFTTASVIGILRLPTFFSRLHAVGKADTLGVSLMLLGLMIKSGATFTSAKIGLIVLFVLVTNPLSTHIMARTAFRRWRQKMDPKTFA